MARIDRYIAFGLLAFSVGYGYLAWVHPLLPFEVRMPFKPNTMPIGLAAFGILFSSLLLLLPSTDGIEKDADGWRICVEKHCFIDHIGNRLCLIGSPQLHYLSFYRREF